MCPRFSGFSRFSPEGGGRRAGYGSYEATVDALEQAVSHTSYIAGDRFIATDIYAARRSASA